MTDNPAFPSSALETIRNFLRQAEIRVRLWGLLETILWLFALGCMVFLLGIGALALREFWAFSPPVYAGLAAMVGFWALGLLIWRGFRRIRQEQVAFLIEQRHPELNNSLISSVQLTSRGEATESHSGLTSASLVKALLHRTADAVLFLDPGDAVDRSQIRRPIRVAGTMAALLLAMGLMSPGVLLGSWNLLLHPIDHMPVRAIFISTEPVSGKILLGQPVTLRAVTSGRRTETLQVEIVPDGGGSRVVEMTPDGKIPGGRGKFSHRTGPVSASFVYRAFLGGDSSETHRLEAVPPPAVGEIEVGYVYPRYARLKSEIRKGSGYIRALKGTEATLSLQTNKPVKGGRLVFGSGLEVPLDVSDSEKPEGRFIILEQDSYRIILQDRWGFENPNPVRYTVEVVPDQSPAIELIQPKGELVVNGVETIGIRYLARDDFGLEDVRLVAEISGGDRREIVLSKVEEARRWESGVYDWELRDLALRPGSVVRAHLVVRDNDVISGPKEAMSKTLVIRVRSPEEEHKRVKDQQAKVSEQLMDLLADQLDLEAESTEKLGESPDGLPLEPKAASGQEISEKPPRANSGPRQFTRADAEALRERAEKMEKSVERLISRIDETLSRVARDRKSGYDSFTDLNALRNNLSYLQREMMPRAREPLGSMNLGEQTQPGQPPGGKPQTENQRPRRGMQSLRRFRDAQKEITQEFERMAVLADDIGKRSQLRDLANLGDRLARAQNRLLDAFDKAKQGDPAAQRALREALNKLRDLMNKLAQGLRNLPVQLPDEFLNTPMNQMMNMDNLSKQLQEIQKRLKAGDLEGARKLAEELVKSLSRMIAALSGAFQQAMNQASNRFGQSAQRQQNILQELLNQQREILEKTQKIEKPVLSKFREMQTEAFQRAEKMAEEAVENLRRLGQAARGPLPPTGVFEEPPGENEAKALGRALSRKDVPEAIETASKLGELSRGQADTLATRKGKPVNEGDKDAMKALRKLGDDFDALVEALKNLPKDPRVVLTPEQVKQLAELRKKQNEVKEKTVAVQKRVEQIMKMMPNLSPEIAKNLGQAGNAMGKATKELGNRRADKAVPPERDAIYWLSRAGSNMRNAMQQMARRGRFGGVPAPSVIQPGGSPSIALQWRPNVGEEEGGRMGASTRDFRLPSKDAYKVPKIYREEVVDALKGNYPPAYREQIEQYFKNLVE